MPGLRSTAEASERSFHAQDEASDDLRQLRNLLVAPERVQLQELQERLDNPDVRANEVSRVLAEAVRICAARDSAMARNLSPLIESVLRNLVRREPAILADTIYPVIGRSIRKAIAAALQDMAQSLNRIAEQSLSVRGLQWRLEAWRTGKSYGEIVLLRSLLYRVEQVFLIHKKTGLLLQQAAAADVVRDADLVSAVLAAIQDFVRDSLAEGGKYELDTIQAGELGYWIQHGPQALLVGVVKGVAPRQLSGVFQATLEQVHRELGEELDAFVGDPVAFEPVRPHLEACLLGSAKPERRRGRLLRWASAGAAILVVLSGLTLLVASIRDTRRWNEYVERLHAEPGILVTNVESRGGRYYLKGLRDPLSRDPADLLREAKVDPSRVTWEWEPFLSQHPRFAADRRFAQQRAEIERRSIHFNLASADVLPAQLDAVREMSASVRALFSAAEAAGQAVRLEVIGHADSLGSRGFNSRLSQDRASRVLRLLVLNGVPQDRLLVRADVSPDVPRQAGAVAGAEMERRVSFRVVPGGT